MKKMDSDDVYEAVFRVNICSNCGMKMEIVDKEYRREGERQFLGVVLSCEGCGNRLEETLIIESIVDRGDNYGR